MSDQLKKSIAQYTQGRTSHPLAHQLDGRSYRKFASPLKAGTSPSAQPPNFSGPISIPHGGETTQSENAEAGFDPDERDESTDISD